MDAYIGCAFFEDTQIKFINFGGFLPKSILMHPRNHDPSPATSSLAVFSSIQKLILNAMVWSEQQYKFININYS